MFTSHKQISPPSLVLKLKISEVSQKWIPKAVELKRIPTHKKCKCKKFCSQTRLVGEIYSSDVIMHRGYFVKIFTNFLHYPWSQTIAIHIVFSCQEESRMGGGSQNVLLPAFAFFTCQLVNWVREIENGFLLSMLFLVYSPTTPIFFPTQFGTGSSDEMLV